MAAPSAALADSAESTAGSALPLPTAPAWINTDDTSLHKPFTNEHGHLVEWYGPERELADSLLEWHQGRQAALGGCTFSVPDVQLEAGQDVIAQRLVATNYTTCEILVETGSPGPYSASADPPFDQISSNTSWLGGTNGQARTDNANLDALLASADTSAYYRIWWEDVVNIWVTKTTVDMWWSFNGDVVEYSEAVANYQWRSGTGWSRHSSSFWSDKNSTRHKHVTNVTYRNSIFCWPGTVWNYYSGQHVTGWYNGSRSGGYSSTYTTYPFACPTLHFHTELGR